MPLLYAITATVIWVWQNVGKSVRVRDQHGESDRMQTVSRRVARGATAIEAQYQELPKTSQVEWLILAAFAFTANVLHGPAKQLAVLSVSPVNHDVIHGDDERRRQDYER